MWDNLAMLKRKRSKFKKASGKARRHTQRNDPIHDWARFEVMVRSQQFAKLALSAVVTKGEKNLDGNIILAVLPAWDEIMQWIDKDPTCVFKIDPWKWEEIIAACYERSGFTVTLTPRSGDLGRDIIAVKDGFWSVRFIESVKRYAPGNPVTANDVRALGHVLQADQDASKGIVSTTSNFAPGVFEDPLIKPFLPNRIELLDGNKTLARLKAAWQSGSG